MADDVQEKLLKVDDLVMYYHTLRGSVKAVDRITFDLKKGEALGLVGESGCGKTSAMLTILRLLPSNAKVVNGKIVFEGRNLLEIPKKEFNANIRWKKISVVFQGAMNALHPMMPVGEQIVEAIMLHEKLSKKAAFERAGKLLDLVGVGTSRIGHYAHELSGGMKQRCMIAMSLASNPDLVVADEPTTALDVIISAQVLKMLKDLQRKLNISLIVVTHDLSMVAEICEKIAIMYAGKMVESGDIKAVFKEPRHPYTQGLIGAFPSVLGSKRVLKSIPGSPPDLLDPPSGCRFHPRCPYALEVCRKEEPGFTEIEEGWRVACHLYR
jgi:peptide/nickel transport system ATP-binding protein